MVTDLLRDDNIVLHPTSGSSEFIGFAVHLDDERIGTVALRPENKAEGSIRWNIRDNVSTADTSRAIRLGIQHAFGSLGWTRIAARADINDSDAIRAAAVAGLRREGIARQVGASDQALLARLSTDPPAFSRDGFIAILNAGLPRKRAISQGLLRDEQGRILLCELTYKSEWDLPGGVVEIGESPATGLVRELEEELGIRVAIGGLVTMNWLPPWSGWDDACLFVFDLGSIPSRLIEDMTLQHTEIKAVHWCDPQTIALNATAVTAELLQSLQAADVSTYRESPSNSPTD